MQFNVFDWIREGVKRSDWKSFCEKNIYLPSGERLKARSPT